jgi:hypothetical protein
MNRAEPEHLKPRGGLDGCPFEKHTDLAIPLLPQDELWFPKSKRVFTAYSTDSLGARQLHLHFGDREICFDEVDLFGFGEKLALQSTFTADSALSWETGLSWERARALLEQLIDEGVIRRSDAASRDPETGVRVDGKRESILPPAELATPKTWFDCEAITQELTGRALEIGYLEMVVPIFRVAHMAMDAEGRQVGEANVFPKALRVDVPTSWRTCIYSGSRFQAELPMNVSALKSMRKDWAQMMAILLKVRAAYLVRFPHARSGWTVGHVERLSTFVLALPTLLLMRTEKRVENGQLHPALSCLFRVTDGLRLTMHQMLFVPVGEAALSPDAPVSSADVFAYAERNYSFHSEFGVCAGPKNMIEEFLSVLIDGRSPKVEFSQPLDVEIQAALEDLDDAFDYAMYGLQVYAAVFSVWPVMTRAYEDIFSIVDAWAGDGSEKVIAYRDQLVAQIQRMRTKTYLATEQWRSHRELAYADMYEQCRFGLAMRSAGLGVAGLSAAPVGEMSFQKLLEPQHASEHETVAVQLQEILRLSFGVSEFEDGLHLKLLNQCLMELFLRKQSILKVACAAQSSLNKLLGRAPPLRPFSAADIDIHNLLQPVQERTLPFLLDELQDLFHVQIAIDQDKVALLGRSRQATMV